MAVNHDRLCWAVHQARAYKHTHIHHINYDIVCVNRLAEWYMVRRMFARLQSSMRCDPMRIKHEKITVGHGKVVVQLWTADRAIHTTLYIWALCEDMSNFVVLNVTGCWWCLFHRIRQTNTPFCMIQYYYTKRMNSCVPFFFHSFNFFSFRLYL